MIGFIVLFVAAATFVLLPLTRAPRIHVSESAIQDLSSNESANRLEQNRRVHAEQLSELQILRDEDRIDEAQFEALQDELLYSVLETETSRGDVPRSADNKPQSISASSTALWLPLSFIMLLVIASSYAYTGYFADTKTQDLLVEFGQQAPESEEGSRVALLDLLPAIEDRVTARPTNTGWRYLLAQLQSELKRFVDAAESYQVLLEQDPGNADLWAGYGQALYLANSRRMSPDIEQALNRAVSINPHQQSALGLQGMHAFETEDYALAAQAWGKLLEGLPAGSKQRSLIRNARTEALSRLAAAEGAPQIVGGSQPAEIEVIAQASGNSDLPADNPMIAVSVSVDESLPLASSDAVFIYARAANGPKMPLAIVRMTVADLPAEVELHDGLAMMPAMKLSMFDDIELIARVSRNGSAAAAAGDWQASTGALKRSTIDKPINLYIDSQI